MPPNERAGYLMMTNPFDPLARHDPERVLALYEWLRPEMPDAGHAVPHHAPRLRDLMGEFDALLLDGYGVLNVGAYAVPEADLMLAEAEAAGVAVIVVTNGGSKDSKIAAARYRTLGFDVTDQQVVSSRDALETRLRQPDCPYQHIGVVDSWCSLPSLPGISTTPLTPENPAEWYNVDAICLFGGTQWDERWQDCLLTVAAKGMPVLVANPDIGAPQSDGFSKEPGYWAVMARHQLGDALQLEWYGKPHQPVFDLAMKTLEETTGRSNWNYDRIAMVGDTLHTDILGGRGAGLKTVLVTGHGMFREGSANDAIEKTGIAPDYIVRTV